MKICDMHTHSNYSDGSLSPAGLVKRAQERGISALALTDHNTSKGLRDFMDAGEASGLITVPGCEFSTDYEIDGVKKELHIVGLFFPEENWPMIEDHVDIMRLAKESSNRRMIKALRADGYDVTFEEAARLTDAETFNRAHVARVLVAKGQIGSVKEAFATILKEGNGYYTPAGRLGAIATVRFIKLYGGAAVLAHPFLNLRYDELELFLPHAKANGLDAIETMYSEFSDEMTNSANELADRFGLLRSGGSDFHGEAKPHIELGTGTGALAVPFEVYETLRDAAARK
ncbi:MAG: PHP domain-containing protein [Clostridia bacterium]|nr:PHP domain-containing protein [Clostridia bacterium]